MATHVLLSIIIICTLRINHVYSSIPNKIIKGVNLHQQFVPYANHPYDTRKLTESTNIEERRTLLDQSKVSPIRISAYYDPTTIVNDMTPENYTYVKQLIGAVKSYYSKAIQVVPVSGTFFIEESCANWYITSFGNACYNFDNTCFDMTVPDDHFGERYLYDDSAHTRTRLPAGRGIMDTDLILYVSADGTTTSCQSGAVAHAGPCYQDQYGRPIAGNINICNEFFASLSWKGDVGTILHELTHITIMSDIWDEFRDSNGDIVPVAQVYDTASDPKEIISTNVKQRVRDHFDCITATGLQLDPYSNSHWHEKYVHAENMNPKSFSDLTYYTEFTLALMEDSGWYLPKFEYAEPFAFGKDAGCSYFSDDCVNKASHDSNFPKYFCDGVNNNGCNANYMASGTCYYYSWGSIPSEFQYFSDAQHGGNYKSEFCPWIQPYSNGICVLEDSSSTSRCLDLYQISNGATQGYCSEHICNNWDGNKYTSVDIIWSGSETVTCTHSEGIVRTYKTLSTMSGYQIICPDIDNLCGTNPNFGTCYWGYHNGNKCICAPGYTGTNCNTMDNNINADVILANSKAPTIAPTNAPATVCFQDWDDYNRDYNGQWTQNTVVGNSGYYYGLGIYKSPTTAPAKNLYFDGTLAIWYLGTTVGGSINCQCSVSFYTENIGECSNNWQCWSGSWVDQPNLKTYYGTCTNPPPTTTTTSAPTTDPTNNPSKSLSPTKTPTDNTQNPTPSPTQNPTPAPTQNPIPSPTNQPTPAPTSQPTPSPTDIPTPSPTTNPTPSPTDAPLTPGTPTKAPTDTTNNPSKSPTPAPTNNPTPSPTNNPIPAPTNNPTHSPTNNPTPSPTNIPTPSPSDNPTPSPTNMPTLPPTNQPTKPPVTPGSPTEAPTDTTQSPTNNPIPAPTDIPTPSPTNMPTVSPTDMPTPSPTSDPTPAPSDIPTPAPSDEPTPAPTNNPLGIGETDNPTPTPSDNPTLLPTTSPNKGITNEPSISPTNMPTWRGFDLHWICRYNGGLPMDVSQRQYANILLNALFITLKLISGKSAKYEDGDIWGDNIDWNRAGIINFKMCVVFSDIGIGTECDTFNPLLINDDNNNDGEYDDYEYYAVGTFDIVADQFINRYKNALKTTVESLDFKIKFTNEVNSEINMQNNRRRMRNLLDKSNEFNAVLIEVIDPYNITIVNTESSDTIISDDTMHVGDILWIIVIVILVLGALIIIGIIVFKKCVKKNGIATVNDIKKEGRIKTHVQMNEFGKVPDKSMDIDNENNDINLKRIEGNDLNKTGDDEQIGILKGTHITPGGDNSHLQTPQMIQAINNSWSNDENDDEIIDEPLEDDDVVVTQVQTGVSVNVNQNALPQTNSVQQTSLFHD